MNFKLINSTNNPVSHLAVPGVPKREVPSLPSRLGCPLNIAVGEKYPSHEKTQKVNILCS